MEDFGLSPGSWTHLAFAWDGYGEDVNFYIGGRDVVRIYNGYYDLMSIEADDVNASYNFTNESLDEVITTTPLTLDDNETSPPEVPGLVMNLTGVLYNGTVFEIFFGNESGNGVPVTYTASSGLRIGYPRIFHRKLPEAEIADLRQFEQNVCDKAYCPNPPEVGSPLLVNSRILKIDAPDDPHIPPWPNRSGSILRMACSPGFMQTGGASSIMCGEDGQWAAGFLECCDYAPVFCPELDAELAPLVWETEAPAAQCGATAGTTFYANADITPGLVPYQSFHSRVAFRCPEAHVRMAGSAEIFCGNAEVGNASRPVADYILNHSGGRWIDADGSGAPAEMPLCELDEHWCPIPFGNHLSYVVNSTNGRRLGSYVFYMCLADHHPVSGNVTLRCVSLPDGSGGHWVDSAGRAAAPLQCQPLGWESVEQAPAALASDIELDRRSWSNATLGCLPWFELVHGDPYIYCSLGPSDRPDRPGGAGGRWTDALGNNAELQTCELRHNWCPEIELGPHSFVSHLTDQYRFASIATIRCEAGYRIASGNVTLNCVNHESGYYGIWPEIPLTCIPIRQYCPSMEPVNATIISPSFLNYWVGEVIRMECLEGYERIQGDAEMICEVSEERMTGRWRRADGTAATPLVCSLEQEYCDVPMLDNGFVESLTADGELGSVMELRCQPGFRDPRSMLARRTALCRHNDTAASQGVFSAGTSYSTRDLLRAISLTKLTLDRLDRHALEAVRIETDNAVHRPEDDRRQDEFNFQESWRSQLSSELGALVHDRHVKAALRYFNVAPPYDRLDLSKATHEDVRFFLRLLTSQSEEHHDITAEEALKWFGAFDRLKVNFQDRFTVPPPHVV